ncbi:MAG: helix-turn-helix domain-containing protein [Alphaproteobacteria bacterium]
MANSQMSQRTLMGGDTAASFTLSQIYVQIIHQKIIGYSSGKKTLYVALRATDISQPTWSRLTAGKATISFEKMKLLCDELSLDFMEILGEVLELSNKLQAHGHMAQTTSRHADLANKDILRFFIKRVDKQFGDSAKY